MHHGRQRRRSNFHRSYENEHHKHQRHSYAFLLLRADRIVSEQESGMAVGEICMKHLRKR